MRERLMSMHFRLARTASLVQLKRGPVLVPERAGQEALPRDRIDALRQELGEALKHIEPVIETDHDEPRLVLPGHHPVHAPMLRPKRGIGGWLERARVYEETSTVLLSYLLLRMDVPVFFDIGSAKGHFTRIAASRIAEPPRVFSFEMRPDTAEVQRRLLARDSFGANAVVNDVALTDVHVGGTRVWTARSSLYEEMPPPSEYQEAWHRRLKFWFRRDDTRGLKPADLLLTTLDAFADMAEVTPDLVKIDVDGYEMKVLKGARRILESRRPLLMLELHTDKKQRFGTTRADVADYLFDHGYRALLLTDHQDRLSCKIQEVGRDDPAITRQQTNLFLFAHEDTALPPRSTALRVVAGRG